MTTFDRSSWEERWARALREHGDALADRPPNAYLTAAAADLRPGVALDAGCGHGAEAIWLAGRGWRVTAVDFSATALAHGRATAEALGADVAGRVDWVEGDLAEWAPQAGGFDLVVCLFVNVTGAVDVFVRRMAAGVAPGGSLLLVGFPAAAGQVQVSVAAAVAALEPGRWELLVAEERPRAQSGVDAVIHARTTAA